MKQRQKYIIYLISITLLITIGVQIYWNYKNYLQNKQQVISDVQNCLNSAVEEYYAKQSEKDYLTLVTSELSAVKDLDIEKELGISISDLIKEKEKHNNKKFDKKDLTISKKSQYKNENKEKSIDYYKSKLAKNKDYKLYYGKTNADSLSLHNKINSIYISISTDTIRYSNLDSLLNRQLIKCELTVNYNFKHWRNDTVYYQSKPNFSVANPLRTVANSTFVKKGEKLELIFANPVYQVLKRSILGISLSLFLSLLIIISLFYLLYVISKQKQLAIIKNDLISNITHEFKTPISTAMAAIEALIKFNIIDNREKALNYLNISDVQLRKLYQMVEKLLETATLDSDRIQLKKEQIDVVEMLNKMAQRFQLLTEKNIVFNTDTKMALLNIDIFHFENAIGNIIDNAIKYGGDTIELNISNNNQTLIIEISDNGKGIPKAHRERIFDKFYRIPQGNTHNVKGFGIGLYYTKQIIEKHGGEIQLEGGAKFQIMMNNKNNI